MPVDPHGDPVVTGKKDKASSKMASGLNLTAFQDVVRSVNGASFAGELQRKQAVADASALLARLESPWETASRLAWGHPTLMGCIATLTMLGFFQKWVQAGGGSKLESELAKLVPCDPVLLSKMTESFLPCFPSARFGIVVIANVSATSQTDFFATWLPTTCST